MRRRRAHFTQRECCCSDDLFGRVGGNGLLERLRTDVTAGTPQPDCDRATNSAVRIIETGYQRCSRVGSTHRTEIQCGLLPETPVRIVIVQDFGERRDGCRITGVVPGKLPRGPERGGQVTVLQLVDELIHRLILVNLGDQPIALVDDDHQRFAVGRQCNIQSIFMQTNRVHAGAAGRDDLDVDRHIEVRFERLHRLHLLDGQIEFVALRHPQIRHAQCRVPAAAANPVLEEPVEIAARLFFQRALEVERIYLGECVRVEITPDAAVEMLITEYVPQEVQ